MGAARGSVAAGGADCPLCHASSRPCFDIAGHVISDCPACGHRFSASVLRDDHVDAVYGDAYFHGGGDGYDDYLGGAELLRAQGRRYGRILSRHAVPGRVLDVGSAAGFLQAGLEAEGWTSSGLEPNAAMAAHARERLGLDAHQGSLEDPPEWPAFDAICMIQVIGHFFDLPRALSSAARLTRPGGLCLIEYWQRDAWVARLLGRKWHEYSPPSVLHWYTRDSLDRAMKANGFDCIESGVPKKYILGSHARSLLSHKLRQLPLGSVLAAPARLIPASLPIRYPAFDLEWRLYRRDRSAVPQPETADHDPGDTQ